MDYTVFILAKGFILTILSIKVSGMALSDLCSTKHHKTQNGTIFYNYKSEASKSGPSHCSCLMTAQNDLMLDITVSPSGLDNSGSVCNPCMFIDGPGFTHHIKPHSEERTKYRLMEDQVMELNMMNPDRLSHRTNVIYSASGGTLDLDCKLRHLEVKAPTRTLLQDGSGGGAGMSAGIIAGAIAGGGLVVAVIIVICVLFCRKYYKKEPVPDGMTTMRSAEQEGKAFTVSDGNLHNTSLNGPVATYYDPRNQKSQKNGKKRSGLPGGGNSQLQHSISFETIYGKDSKLPARGGVLRNSQRKKRTKRYSSGQGSSSDDSNTSMDQPSTGRVSMDPRGKNKRKSNISQVSSNIISSGDSSTMSPNTSTDCTGITNTGYEATFSSSSAEEYSFDTSQESSVDKRNVTFAKGVPVDNYKGKPKRSKKAKTELAMKLAAKTPPPKYRQKSGKENGAIPIQGQSGLVRRNSSKSRRRNSGRRTNSRSSDGRRSSDSGRGSDGARAPPSPRIQLNTGHANPTFVPDSPVTSNPPKSPESSSPQSITPQNSPPTADVNQTSPQNPNQKSPTEITQNQNQPVTNDVNQQQVVYQADDQQQQYMDYQQQMQYAAYMQQYYQDPQYAQQMVPQSETYQPMQYVDPNYYQQAYQQQYYEYDPNNPAVTPNVTVSDSNAVAVTQNTTASQNTTKVPTKSPVQYQTDPSQNVHNQSTVLNSSVETEV